MREFKSRIVKKNFLINLFEGAFFMAGSALISAQTVLPALVNRLGGGNIAIGALGVIAWIGLFIPQTFAARYAQAQPWKKRLAVKLGLIQRIVILCVSMILFLFGGSNTTLTLALFLTLYALFQILTGVATPFWFDMYAKLTPVDLRGKLSGLRSALAGSAAFVGTFFLTWLLKNYGFPESYILIFLTTFTLQLISIILQFGIIEEQQSNTVSILSMSDYFKQLRNVFLKNIPFRKFLFTSTWLILAAMPIGFFTVYGLKHFNSEESIVGQFTLIVVAGQGIGALIIGYFADRYGNKLALIIAACALLIANLIALFSPTIELFKFSFLFMGMNLSSELMTRHNLALEYSPIEQRSAYIGLMNTALAPMYLSGLIAGWLSNLIGYKAVFLTGCICSIIGTTLLIVKVHEPRSMVSQSDTNK